jgi:hypothetical protein
MSSVPHLRLHEPSLEPAASEKLTERLTEHVRDWRCEGVSVDREGRYVRNVALAGTHSSNGYRYSERALRDAVPLYAGKPVFLDHARVAGRPYDRSTRDLVGSVVRPRFEGGRVRGDIRVIDTEAGRTFLALADSDSAAVGMSHVVLAERSADGQTVERLREIVSVDAVAFPASTKSLSESQGENQAGQPAGEDHADITALHAERERLQGEIADLHRERAALTEQIDERRSVLNTHPTPRPLSMPREPFTPHGISDERLIAAIRRR